MSIYGVREFLQEIRQRPEHFCIIHYSCQSLYDDNEGLSPRVTSIVVMHLGSEQTLSFSTHAMAEELGIPKDQVESRFDDIERRLLEKFYAFVRDRRDLYWLHWNMRNLVYGFEHIEHRYRTLTKSDSPSIPVERRLNLNDYLSMRYGAGYVVDPKLQKLMEINGGIHRHFLTGAQEVEAFKSHEFIKMHNSTLCKVGFMKSVVRKVQAGKLHTTSKGYGQKLDRLFESRLAKIIALLVGAIGLIASTIAIYQFAL